VKTILKVKLITDEFQYRALLRTMNVFNQVCNQISERAFKEQEFQKIQLQNIVYHDVREAHKDFSSQLTIRAIDVVSCSYKTKRGKHPNRFKRVSAVVYDDRVITFRGTESVNIWTAEGRLNIPVRIWDRERFAFRKGQVDLILQNGTFFLLCTLEIPTPDKYHAEGVIGVDLGVKKIAVASDGSVFSGEAIEKKRQQYHKHRQRLQMRGTRSAKRRIKTSGSKESRFRKDTNHCISRLLVQKAKALNFGIALEELTNINKRVTVRHKTEKDRQNCSARMSWSFAQLRQFITYKTELCGVPLMIVPAPYTSQTCSSCGHCEKKNRKNQTDFCCVSCGHAENADFNASKNIQNLGLSSISLLLAPSALVASPAPRGRGN
jgi:IS605 OrfB family transposase